MRTKRIKGIDLPWAHVYGNTAHIYCIYNDITNYYYVGTSSDLCNRILSHKHYLELQEYETEYPLFQEHYNEYGPESFQFIILDRCLKKDMFKLESMYISNFSISRYIYNNRFNDQIYYKDLDINSINHSLLMPFIHSKGALEYRIREIIKEELLLNTTIHIL